MTITSITKLTDDRLLVQLQGQYGNSQLLLPMNQQAGLSVGQEFHLQTEPTSLPFIGQIDEVAEKGAGRAGLTAPQTMPRVPFAAPGQRPSKPPKS